MVIDYRQVGARLAKERKAQNMTQEALSEMTGITNNYISNIENSRSIPSLETLMKLCGALNVTPDCLLLGTTKHTDDYLLRDISEKLTKCDGKQRRLALKFIDFIINEKL